MCVSVVVDGEREIDGLYDLRQLLDGRPIVPYEGFDVDPDDACLCGIDLDKTLEDAGFKVTWPDHRMYCEVVRPK